MWSTMASSGSAGDGEEMILPHCCAARRSVRYGLEPRIRIRRAIAAVVERGLGYPSSLSADRDPIFCHGLLDLQALHHAIEKDQKVIGEFAQQLFGSLDGPRFE